MSLTLPFIGRLQRDGLQAQWPQGRGVMKYVRQGCPLSNSVSPRLRIIESVINVLLMAIHHGSVVQLFNMKDIQQLIIK